MRFKNDGLTFDPKNHVYKYKNKKLDNVTSFVKKFRHPFNRVRMSLHVAERDNRAQEEVLEDWNDRATSAKEFGSNMHKYFEIYLNNTLGKKEIVTIPKENVTVPNDRRELLYWRHFIQFWKEHLDLIPKEVERKIFVPTWKIAGTVDLIAQDTSGRHFIIDWKTNREIKMEGFRGRTMRYPLNHVQDCSYREYCLQMSMYAYMLETRYHCPIRGLLLVHFTPSGYTKYRCPYLLREVKTIIDHKFARLGGDAHGFKRSS